VCIDVFECKEVKEKQAYQELLRVTKPGGLLVLEVAAFQFLLSEHDDAVHSVRRYNKKSARLAFLKKNTEFLKMQYSYFFLFPVLALIKLFKKNTNKTERPQSDLIQLPTIINTILYSFVWLESKLSISYPFGTSLFLVIKKKI
jgi:hypothetical protein